jgi:hypothetical protein
MRVLLYIRGIERYNMYAEFFERFLQKDWDGLYVDWAKPFSPGFCKTTPLHFSAYDAFMYGRALRQRVGEKGVLIAHTSIQTYLATSIFDAVIVGEFSVMHGGLLADPETSASYALLGGCGVNLIAGNSPDRAVFSSQTSSAYCAGLAYSAHPFMEPGKAFDEVSAYMHPIWNLWRALESPPVRVFNPAVGEADIAASSHEALHPVVYVAEDGSALVLVTNLGASEVSGTVDLDLERLGLKGGSVLTPVRVAGTHVLRAEGARIHCDRMPPWFYGGLLVRSGR